MFTYNWDNIYFTFEIENTPKKNNGGFQINFLKPNQKNFQDFSDFCEKIKSEKSNLFGLWLVKININEIIQFSQSKKNQENLKFWFYQVLFPKIYQSLYPTESESVYTTSKKIAKNEKKEDFVANWKKEFKKLYSKQGFTPVECQLIQNFYFNQSYSL